MVGAPEYDAASKGAWSLTRKSRLNQTICAAGFIGVASSIYSAVS
jgi:hypothetical protein